MTDRSRATDVIPRLAALGVASIAAREEVAAQFRAVRLEERRAVVAWLRRTADRRRIGLGAIAAAELEDAADSIIRGEHEARS